MTIAGFYLCPEGLVLGADSTSSFPADGGMHFFDFNQKVYEIGEESTLALVTWGLGNLWPKSYRTLVAELADALLVSPAISVADVAQRWIDQFWVEYQASSQMVGFLALQTKTPFDINAAVQASTARTEAEESEYAVLKNGLVVGFCLGGYVLPNRHPQVAHMVFDPMQSKPTATVVSNESNQWWGVPNIIDRLIYGADENLVQAIISSGKWTGNKQELIDLVVGQRLTCASLPIRDAIDFVHTCIQCTIKAMKFSSFSQVCGGPIEIAVITSDRKFRWVKHKAWDAAIKDGGL